MSDFTRQVSAIAAVALSACAGARAASRHEPSVASGATCARAGYRLDADSASRAVRESYAYLADKAVDWDRAARLAGEAADTVRSTRQLVGVLERSLDNLYDAHAVLRANTMHSPRLVPSGLDLWAEWRGNRAVVTAVRPGFSAEQQGIRPGMQVIGIDDLPVDAAAGARLGAAVERPAPADARAWALLSALAGRHDARRLIRARDASGVVRDFALDGPGQHVVDAAGDEPPVEIRRIAADQSGDGRTGYGYIRLTALGDSRSVPAFDTALTTLRDSPGLVLDLRDTPQGGRTDVAEPILGRLIDRVESYQRVVPRHGPAYVRSVSPRGPWTYTGPVVVLVGRWTGSMGEGMAIGLDGMHRAVVVGTAMAGLAGAVDDIGLPCSGLLVALPTARLLHLDGTPRERWLPPVRVDLVAEERRRAAGDRRRGSESGPSDGGDPVLACGIDVLGALVRRGGTAPGAPPSRSCPSR